MKQEKEEQIFSKRIVELAKTAYHREINVYTDFLNLNEISIFHSIEKLLPPVPYSLYGGFEGAERCVLCFYGRLEGGLCDLSGTELEDRTSFPIQCLRISPKSEKFAQELDHRDYLGAIMNTGTVRPKIGDIVVKGKEAYCCCDEKIAGFLQMSIEKIGHTNVEAEIISDFDQAVETNYREISGSVPSFRLDAMISLAFHTSRSGITGLIEGEKVYVNARLVTQNSYVLKPGDVVSVRGYGKFRFKEEGNQTKKGRIYAHILLYV